MPGVENTRQTNERPPDARDRDGNHSLLRTGAWKRSAKEFNSHPQLARGGGRVAEGF